ncbi:hypothetical protein [Geodermatophilus sp. CPCC 205506]|uniref:hypothetical protein n=1 Tax=Geodermatophilus sp. CPCC 205506 TaxID=2936596 RepID=UPI003EED9945
MKSTNQPPADSPAKAPLQVRKCAHPSPAGALPAAQSYEDHRRDDAGLYADILFGDATGYVCGATGKNPFLNAKNKYSFSPSGWHEFALRWPDQRDELVDAIVRAADAQVDLFVCPYLRVSEDRKRGSAVERRFIHADIDGELSTEKVQAVGGFAVDSGTEGHGHVYIALSAPVDVRQHEVLCRALGRYLGNADAKVSDNDVLRPPGSVNRKPTVRGVAASPVRWLVKP